MTGTPALLDQRVRSAEDQGRRSFLRFRQPALEHAYRDYLFTTRRRSTVICLVIAVLLITVVEPLTALWSSQETPAIARYTRWLVNLPVLVLALFTCQSKANSLWKERTLLLALVCMLMTNAA